MDTSWAPAFFGGSFLVMTLVGLAAIALVIWAIVDLFSRPMDGPMRLLWLLVILFFPFIGSLIYLVAGRSMRSRAV
jgi:hypothetical protein